MNHKNFLRCGVSTPMCHWKFHKAKAKDLTLKDMTRGQGQGLENVSSRTLEAKDMSSRTPSLMTTCGAAGQNQAAGQ